MRKHKIQLIILLCVIAAIIISFFLFRFLRKQTKPTVTVNCPSEISSVGIHPGNNRQYAADIWLGCYNSQLYYFNGKHVIDGKSYTLFRFQNNSLKEVATLSHKNGGIKILGMVKSYIYYGVFDSKNYQDHQLYCYDLERNVDVRLYTGNLSFRTSSFFADDGSVYIPLLPEPNEKTQFVHISGQNMLGIKTLTLGYPLGNSVYHVLSEYEDVQVERVLQADENGNIMLEEIPFGQAYSRSVIPYDGGLLVHNEKLNSLLYRIDKDGNVTGLFNIPCLASQSAVNIHGTDAYISLLRYEKYGSKGMLRYENDSQEGTYRISLIDGSIEKINGTCLSGIYNFDDTCFYCCDDRGNVYKMDFDGTINPILLFEES